MNQIILQTKIPKSKQYSLEEIAELLKVDIPTVRTWRDLGVFSQDKRKVYRLKVVGDYKDVVLGRHLVVFLDKYNLNLLL